MAIAASAQLLEECMATKACTKQLGKRWLNSFCFLRHQFILPKPTKHCHRCSWQLLVPRKVQCAIQAIGLMVYRTLESPLMLSGAICSLQNVEAHGCKCFFRPVPFGHQVQRVHQMLGSFSMVSIIGCVYSGCTRKCGGFKAFDMEWVTVHRR